MGGNVLRPVTLRRAGSRVGLMCQAVFPRCRHRVAFLVGAAAAAGLGSGLSPGSSGSAHISIKRSPRIIGYTHKVRVSGKLSTGQAGVRVTLEAKPFHATAFKRVASKDTGKHGAFTFKPKPTLATKYRVRSTGGLRSNTVTSYVDSLASHYHCTDSAEGETAPCGEDESLHGPATAKLRASFHLLYPAPAFDTEKGKPIYVYFGQHNGGPGPPNRLELRKQVSQQPLAANKTKVSVTVRHKIPAGEWHWIIAFCAKTSERVDGLGLPGAPGSHHCGQESITFEQARGSLG
jgi:hypothetical protein